MRPSLMNDTSTGPAGVYTHDGRRAQILDRVIWVEFRNCWRSRQPAAAVVGGSIRVWTDAVDVRHPGRSRGRTHGIARAKAIA